jgi:hypothetical protein
MVQDHPMCIVAAEDARSAMCTQLIAALTPFLETLEREKKKELVKQLLLVDQRFSCFIDFL